MKKVFSETMLMLLLINMLTLAYNIQQVKASRTDYIGTSVLLSNPWGDWKHYHNYTEIVNTLIFLNETYPNLVDVFSIGKSWQDRDIYCVRLTNESDTRSKPQVFFVGYHHAREPITAELALYFIVDALTEFGANATITCMLNNSEIYIVPALNVDGFDLFKVNDWQRKNARPTDEDLDGRVDEDPPEDENHDGFIEQLYNLTDGQFIRWEGIDNDADGKNGEDWVGGVDLNRNYDYQWQSGSSDPQSEIYKGPAPFSEPETQAVRNLVSSHNFTYAISFHSGGELILYPWAYTHTNTPDATKFVQIAQDLSSLTGGTTYEQSSDLYISYGSWEDWMYGTKHVFALTCEIFSNDTFEVVKPGPYPNTLWEGGLRYIFNPFPNSIESTLLRWFPVFTYIINRTISETQHNIAISKITVSKTVVQQGFSIDINVTVIDRGDFMETFNVAVYANMTRIETKSIVLGGKSSTTIGFTWNTTGFGIGNYTVSAYASPVPGETETADNRKEYGLVAVAIAGDFNGDGKVDGSDFYILLQAWGTTPPSDPRADANCDGTVDGSDFYALLVSWVESYP